MEVKVGLAAEYGAKRFDVNLDETDLLRIIKQHGIGQNDSGVGHNLTEIARSLPEDAVFQLLYLEAERYKLVQAPKFGEPVELAQAALQDNRRQLADLLAVLKGTSAAAEMKRMGLA